MRSRLNNTTAVSTVFKNANTIGIANSAKAVGNDDSGSFASTFLYQLVETSLYNLFTFIVQGRCGLIKDENRRITKNGTCNGNLRDVKIGSVVRTKHSPKS